MQKAVVVAAEDVRSELPPQILGDFPLSLWLQLWLCRRRWRRSAQVGFIGARSYRCRLGLPARILEFLVPVLIVESRLRILICAWVGGQPGCSPNRVSGTAAGAGGSGRGVPNGSDVNFSRCVTSLSCSARVAHALPTIDLVASIPHFPVAEGHAPRVRAVPFALASARWSEAGELCRRENSPASVDRLSVVALWPRFPPRRRRPRSRSSINLARRHRRCHYNLRTCGGGCSHSTFDGSGGRCLRHTLRRCVTISTTWASHFGRRTCSST